MSEPQKTAGPITVLLSQQQALVVVTSGTTGQVLHSAAIAPGAEDEDAPREVARYADAVVRALAGVTTSGTVHLGLPGSWLTHTLVDIPPMRRVDEVARLVREASKSSGMSSQDLLLASESPRHGRSKSRDARTHFAVSARQDLVLALVDQLGNQGVRVRFASSGPGAAIVQRIRDEADRAPYLPATAIALLRRDGFAIALHQGSRMHQFRLVGVALPEDDVAVAQVLVEEIRRSSMSFREKTRGGTIERIVILGRIMDDPAAVAEMVGEVTGIPTTLGSDVGPEGDVWIEARALRAARPGSGIDLLPPELTGRRRGIAGAVLAASVVVAGLASAWFGAGHLAQRTADRQQALVEATELRDTLSGELQRHDRVLRRAREYAALKQGLEDIGSRKVDPVDLIRQVTESLPDTVRLRRIALRSPTSGDVTCDLEGVILSDEWDYDHHLAALIDRVRDATGHSPECTSSASDRDRSTGATRPFELRMEWKTRTDETAQNNVAAGAP